MFDGTERLHLGTHLLKHRVERRREELDDDAPVVGVLAVEVESSGGAPEVLAYGRAVIEDGTRGIGLE